MDARREREQKSCTDQQSREATLLVLRMARSLAWAVPSGHEIVPRCEWPSGNMNRELA